MADATDRDDIDATLRGDGAAYSRLIERHQQAVASLMWRFTRDRRVYEELVQDVFVEAYLSLSRYRAAAPWRHWLLRIATRVGYRHWKRQSVARRRGEVSLLDHDAAETVTAAGSAASVVGSGPTLDDVQRMLARLRPRDRLVLTMIYLEGHSIEETASLCGWSRTLTKVQAFRARRRLKKLLLAEPPATESTQRGE